MVEPLGTPGCVSKVAPGVVEPYAVEAEGSRYLHIAYAELRGQLGKRQSVSTVSCVNFRCLRDWLDRTSRGDAVVLTPSAACTKIVFFGFFK